MNDNVFWPAFIALAFGALLLYGFIAQQLRSRALRQYAETQKLTYCYDQLPRTLSINGTEMLRYKPQVVNAVWGRLYEHDYVVFDVRVRLGKGSRLQTVLAVNTTNAERVPDGMFQGGSSTHREQLESWTIYSTERVVSTDELQQWTEDILHSALRIEAKD